MCVYVVCVVTVVCVCVCVCEWVGVCGGVKVRGCLWVIVTMGELVRVCACIRSMMDDHLSLRLSEM